ncbi:MAG: DctP family TRAP transporter solute-binding subunit [Lachnospiraceae bacterium]|nr:DctP family TRAP transporter solute-binding subunit [Lachnospiraceae bacterium]
MKKKALCGALALVLSLGLLVGCRNSSSEAQVSSTDGAKQEVINLSVFSGSIAENTPTGDALKQMVKYINENSEGTLNASAYFDTALGDATSMVQGLQQGTIDIGVTGTAYFSGLVPEVEVFQLPFLFSDIEEARAAVDGEASDKIFQKFEEKGIVGVCFWENGFRQLSNDVREVNTPSDLAGIKMRTLPAPVQVETWKALGALPTTIDAAELYTALQQGTVSAEENPLHEIVSRKFYEVQKYITLTSHVYTPQMMGMSAKTWAKLNNEQKKVIMDAANVGKEAQRETNVKATEEALKTLLDYGCVVNETPDIDAFKEIATKTWSIFTDEYGTELIDIIQNK